jgi:molecular chaperone GrpE
MEEMKTSANETEVKTEAPKADKKKVKKADAELAELTKKLEAKTAECEECNDRYMRMMAEYDNFRKRSAKEKEGVWADAYSDCIAHLLPILDNLERASKSDNVEAVTKGLEMTVKAFGDAMEKMGVKEIECKTFDPNLHNAVMHVEDEAYGEGEIVEVLQKGYIKGDRVLRYAMVKVAN